ncbi:Ger(x)C family spore germination protein [Lysinibacillus sphaericus]|uniref:Ger(x)C family spore germination protein n=1 Tax=Lysinibacillus sphaericus TaxID=1421 RepID=UPI003F7ADDA6
MYRKGMIVLIVIFLMFLAGCWDERLYKNSSVVTLVGVDGQIGDYTGYYAYPKTTANQNEIMIIESTGLSPRDVRDKANMKIEQTLDLSELSTILISDDTAKAPLYDILDIYFRDPQNPISIKMAITEGSVKPYLELTKDLADSAGGYYQRLIESSEENTIYPKLDLQTVGSLLFDNAMDNAIPYMKLNQQENRAEAAGVALFSGQTFTGKVLDSEQTLIMLLLMNQAGQHVRLTYMWELDGKEIPVTSAVIHVKRKWTVDEEFKTIKMDYTIDIEVDEFAHDKLYENNILDAVHAMIETKVQADFEEVLQILQQQKSDTLGIGRHIRSYHPKMFKEDWHEQFASLTLEPKVKVKIIRTGVLR